MTVTLTAMSKNENVVEFGDVHGYNEISSSVNKRPRPQHLGQLPAYPHRIEMDEETVEDLRRGVRAMLAEKLSKQLGGCNKRVFQAARLIEHLLHKEVVSGASDLSDYAEPARLNQKLARLMGKVMERQQTRACRKTDRLLLLQMIIGKPKCREIMSVCHQVKSLRLQRASMGCANGICRLQRSSDLKQLPREMPSVVKDLYFRNDLVKAVEETPVSSLGREDWVAHLEQARRQIAAYNSWLEAAKKP